MPRLTPRKFFLEKTEAEAQRLGKEVQKYLEEKLASGQILYNRDSFDSSEAFHTHPSDANTVWFRVYKVPVDYWEKVIYPELQRFAKRYDRQLKVIYDGYRTGDGYISFFLAEEEELE